jgi:hypothetical protein
VGRVDLDGDLEGQEDPAGEEDNQEGEEDDPEAAAE